MRGSQAGGCNRNGDARPLKRGHTAAEAARFASAAKKASNPLLLMADLAAGHPLSRPKMAALVRRHGHQAYRPTELRQL
jgi:hypothetical protein